MRKWNVVMKYSRPTHWDRETEILVVQDVFSSGIPNLTIWGNGTPGEISFGQREIDAFNPEVALHMAQTLLMNVVDKSWSNIGREVPNLIGIEVGLYGED